MELAYLMAWVASMLLHELGHYAAALWYGVRVERVFLFYDANDRALLRWRIGRTVFGIGWLPLGSYIETAGTARHELCGMPIGEAPLAWEMQARTRFQQGAILVAGCTVNAVIALATAHWYGWTPFALVNGAMALFNMLPMAGMDGGRVVALIHVGPTAKRVMTLAWAGFVLWALWLIAELF